VEKIKFASRKALDLYTKVKKHSHQLESGQRVQVGDNELILDGAAWKEYEPPKVEMSLYDMNAQLISQLPTLTEEQINDKIKVINDFASNINSNYYMLLCKEMSYYTVFVNKKYDGEFETVGHALVTCLDWCEVKSIDALENEIEIWIVYKETAYCMHFFDYQSGIVEFG
jgi:hypothetical protein